MKTRINYFFYLIFFICIYIIVNLGFYKSYFIHLSEYSFTVHFHGAVIAAWFIYVILQTFLMLTNKKKWHKHVGWSSVVLALLIILSIVGITRMGYRRDLSSGADAEQLNIKLLSPYMDILYFSLFYVFAIYNRKKTNSHFKYIIAATLILFGPAIGRFVFFNFPEYKYAMFIVTYYADVIIICFWLIEIVKSKTFSLKNDYLTIELMLIIYHFINSNFANSEIWQSIAKGIVSVFNY